jgi:hypothetical protein
MAKVEQNLKANAWADPGSYANKLGPTPALFQYGLHDEDWMPLADAKDYIDEFGAENDRVLRSGSFVECKGANGSRQLYKEDTRLDPLR